jgi:hypothetical protein
MEMYLAECVNQKQSVEEQLWINQLIKVIDPHLFCLHCFPAQNSKLRLHYHKVLGYHSEAPKQYFKIGGRNEDGERGVGGINIILNLPREILLKVSK